MEVTLEGLDTTNCSHRVVLRGYVVRVEPFEDTSSTGVGLLFTE
jgi:hypothetical protein